MQDIFLENDEKTSSFLDLGCVNSRIMCIKCISKSVYTYQSQNSSKVFPEKNIAGKTKIKGHHANCSFRMSGACQKSGTTRTKKHD